VSLADRLCCWFPTPVSKLVLAFSMIVLAALILSI
jgi:hypothetical protein